MKSKPSHTAFITGVSSGIGLAIAKVLIQKNCLVIGSLRSQSRAEELRQELGQNFIPVQLDLTNKEQMDALPAKLDETLQGQALNVLVNNAGVAAFGPMEYYDLDEFKQLMDTNVNALLRTTQIALPFLKKDTANAKIINISSGAGKMVRPYLGAYAASKHAVEAISDALRRELQMIYGIQVVVVQAGPIKTAIWKKSKEKANPYVHTEYGQIMSKLEDFVQDAEKIALPSEKLGQLVWKIIKTKQPKTRYLIAPKKWMFYLAMYVLPDRMLDKLFTKQLNAYLRDN